MAAKQPSVRRDPERRYHDVTAPINNLIDRDEKRHYVYVHKACEFQGPDYYEALGYEIEKLRPGGPRPKVGFSRLAKDSNIEIRGHVLMSIARTELEKIEEFGADGNTGYDLHRRLQKRVLENGGILKDTPRGADGRPLLRTENESSFESR